MKNCKQFTINIFAGNEIIFDIPNFDIYTTLNLVSPSITFNIASSIVLKGPNAVRT